MTTEFSFLRSEEALVSVNELISCLFLNYVLFIKVNLYAMNCTGRVDVHMPTTTIMRACIYIILESSPCPFQVKATPHERSLLQHPVDQSRLLINGITICCVWLPLLSIMSLGFTPVAVGGSLPLPFYD